MRARRISTAPARRRKGDIHGLFAPPTVDGRPEYVHEQLLKIYPSNISVIPIYRVQ
jgi:hypothetical protein